MTYYLTAGCLYFTFPRDEKIDSKYKGKRLLVGFTANSASIDGKQLTGYTAKYFIDAVKDIPFV